MRGCFVSGASLVRSETLVPNRNSRAHYRRGLDRSRCGTTIAFRLRRNMNDDIEAELAALVPRYLAARCRDLVKMRELLPEHQWDEIRRLGHKMAGTGATYGLSEISRLGSAIEAAARAADADAIGTLLDELHTTIAV